MAKTRGPVTTAQPHHERRSPDPPYVETPGGLVIGAVGFENLTGTPPEPKIRGNAPEIGQHKIGRGSAPRKSGVLGSFIMENK